MATKEETYLQRRIQKYIESRGGYIRKSHGNMITEKGLSDLSFTYKSISCYLEIKTPEAMKHKATGPSEEQGIHCRLAKKAGGITAIITNKDQVKIILDGLDYCDTQGYSVKRTINEMSILFVEEGLDDGTKY